MSRIRKAAESLAQALYRRPEETRSLTESRSLRLKTLVFFSMSAMVVGLLAAAFVVEAGKWDRTRVDVAIPSGDWKVVFAETPLSGPDDARLWSSALKRTDPEHSKRSREHAGKYLWIGAELAAAQVLRAGELGANNLILGWFNGRHRIWVDGQLYVSSDWKEREPVIVTLPAGRLAEARPLRIAVDILHDVFSPKPDNLPPVFGAGLATKYAANQYRRHMSFWTEVRPLVLLAVNLVLAIVFYLLWTTTKEKQEYFYMAMYALATASFHLGPLHLFQRVMGREAEHFFNVAGRFHVAGFGLLLGLALARSRRAIFAVGLPIALLAPFALAWWSASGFRSYQLRDDYDIEAYAMAGYVVGAVACFLQAWWLSRRASRSTYVPVRIRRLVYFGFGLLGLLLLTYLQRTEFGGILVRLLVTRVGHLGLLITMAAIAFREYREERKLLEKTPVSEYHRRPELPAAVTGALLVADLKNSEALFRAGARLGRAGEYVDECLSQLWTAVAGCGGVVLQSEGDALLVFFDREAHAEPIAAALLAAEAMAVKLRLVEEKLRGQGVLDAGARLGFRGGVSTGMIRPVWHEVGETRYAAWVEAGTSNAFVDASRFMELERQVEGGEGTCRCIVADEQVPADGAGRWARRGLVKEGKHGRQYCVAVYDAAPQEPGKRPLAA